MSTFSEVTERELICDYCGNNPGADPRNEILWHGFLDGDTNQFVCNNCKSHHYNEKRIQLNGHMTYSELPLLNVKPSKR